MDMSILDSIKKSVLEGFDTSLAATDIIFGLLAALLAGLFILFIYRRTMQQMTLRRSFCVTLLLLCAISAMMVLTITSNLALSLGMVGALSIVRFRTAVKDSADTAFLFWAVAAGITAGAGFYMLTLIGCLAVGAVCVIAVLLFDRLSKPFLLVVRMENANPAEAVEALLRSEKVSYQLSSLVENPSYAELIYEISFSQQTPKALSGLRALPGVTGVTYVDCRKG